MTVQSTSKMIELRLELELELWILGRAFSVLIFET